MSEKVKVVMVCAAGMSSSLLCTKISEAAKKRGISMEVQSLPSMTYKEIAYDDVSAILIAPQVRGQKSEVERYIASLGLSLPIIQIGFTEYGLVKGEVVLDYLLKALQV
jgi:PTS system cellobiose-specific IIB component